MSSDIEALRVENADLRAKLARYESAFNSAHSVSGWLAHQIVGSDVRQATERMSRATNEWQAGTGALPLAQLVEVVGAFFGRVTRVGLLRVLFAVLLAIATTWISVSQLILLRQQNAIVEGQRRSQDMDLYFQISSKYSEVFRSGARASWVAGSLYGALLRRDQEHPEMVKTMRLQLVSVGDVRGLADAVLESCGLAHSQSSYPTIDEAVRSIDERRLRDAGSEIEQIHGWWKSAAVQCERRASELRTQVQRLEQSLQSPEWTISK